MKTSSIFIFLVLLVLLPKIGVAVAADANVIMLDVPSSRKALRETMKNAEEKSPFLFGEIEEGTTDISKGEVYEMQEEGISYLDEPVNFNEPSRTNGNVLPGKLGDRPKIIEYKDSQILDSVKERSKKGLSFSYFMDTYSYDDANKVFEKTFDKGEKAQKSGFVFLNVDAYQIKSLFNFSLGYGLGAGHCRGHGVFSSDQEKSDAMFKLWIIPFEGVLTMEIPLTSYFKATLSAGPSVVGLMQTRNDFGNGERGKRRRQIGYGYFGTGRLKINLGAIARRSAFKLYSQYNVTKYFFNVEARYQNFSNFQDDITISGVSLGLGLSFEYF